MNEQKALPAKWLQNLFYLHAASLVISAVNAFSDLESITKWIGWAISIGAILCLFRLQNENQRYRKSALFRAAMLGCTLVVSLLSGPAVLTYAASICSFISSYQEYNGHAEMVAAPDPKLSGKWHSLFTWSLLLGVVAGFVSFAVVMIGAMAEAEVALLATVAVVVVLMADAVIEILYLLYMKQTLKLLEKET